MKKIQHTEEARLAAIKYVMDNPELSKTECANHLKIKVNTLYQWLNKSTKEMPKIKELINEADAQTTEEDTDLKIVSDIILELIATLDKLDGHTAPSEMSTLENILFVSLGRVAYRLSRCAV